MEAIKDSLGEQSVVDCLVETITTICAALGIEDHFVCEGIVSEFGVSSKLWFNLKIFWKKKFEFTRDFLSCFLMLLLQKRFGKFRICNVFSCRMNLCMCWGRLCKKIRKKSAAFLCRVVTIPLIHGVYNGLFRCLEENPNITHRNYQRFVLFFSGQQKLSKYF